MKCEDLRPSRSHSLSAWALWVRRSATLQRRRLINASGGKALRKAKPLTHTDSNGVWGLRPQPPEAS